ncbi:uncharacterized protein MEPE_06458 [Melanopsichium pennsylvanicum]|uniref:Uncharacterized protein n=2 Tax=Melanopsichium pennsylvanicum TaxID=63383 RepID=A0AAJ5C8N3_9BASI|nr:uncharacterized protein BN887_03408 [Melanopsichium pennsylvanicum 4]SNX87748.1 uncharacterized protein MEPE_06458 [Melanopsichium pennsylvanicum]
MRSTSFALALVALILSFITLASAQAAAGGGSGVTTTYTGVQSISGYTAPASSVLASPSVSRGTILTTIPGYGNSSTTNESSGSSSGALSLITSSHFMSNAASVTFMLGAVVAAGALLL